MILENSLQMLSSLINFILSYGIVKVSQSCNIHNLAEVLWFLGSSFRFKVVENVKDTQTLG